MPKCTANSKDRSSGDAELFIPQEDTGNCAERGADGMVYIKSEVDMTLTIKACQSRAASGYPNGYLISETWAKFARLVWVNPKPSSQAPFPSP
jgi:hypothetical protein